MRAYVAGRTSDIQWVRAVQRELAACGHDITYDWTVMEMQADTQLHPRLKRSIAEAEVKGVQDAELLVLCWNDAGERSKLGALLEAGAAIFSGTRTIVLNCDRESIFWSLPNVELVAGRSLLRGRGFEVQA